MLEIVLGYGTYIVVQESTVSLDENFNVVKSFPSYTNTIH